MNPPVEGGVANVKDWRNQFLACYIPFLEGKGESIEGNDYASRSCLNLRIGKNKWAPFYVMRSRNLKYFPKDLREDLRGFLKLNAGLSKTTLDRLLSQSIHMFKNIEQVIHGVYDSVLLALPHILMQPKSYNRRLLRRIVTRCFVKAGDMGSYEHLISDWKEFTTYVWVKATSAEVEEEPRLPVENVFTLLLSVNQIRRILRFGIRDKRDCEMLAHLTSSRHMPNGGKISRNKAIQKFVETTGNEFVIGVRDLEALELSARAVGHKVKYLMDGARPKTETHISLSSAGDIDTPSSQGGRGARIREVLTEVLTVVAEEDRAVRLPGGIVAMEYKYYPRWATWFRTTPYEEAFSHPDTVRLCKNAIAKFGDPIGLDDEHVVPDRRHGFDEALGQQIMAVALLEAAKAGVYTYSDDERLRDRWILNYDPPPIPSRISTSQEPGGKSRIVTTTKWWNIILQQSLGHVLRRYLEFHPSARDGLKRADQAWLLLNGLSKVVDLPQEWEILSSDLSESTDCIPAPLGVTTLLKGFMDGVGIKMTKLMEVALVLACSERHVEIRWSRSKTQFITKRRGIFMGEPLAKATLTLLNLCTEEEAMRWYLSNVEKDSRLLEPFGLQDNDIHRMTPVPFVPWRCFRVGGDDHIGVGPRVYLKRITENHKRWGSKISPTKHGQVKNTSAVKYCEKVLYFRDCNLALTTKEINSSLENYDRSAFVDSVKVRLLTPHSVNARDSQNERNTAIGKGLSLGRTLRWLNSDIFAKWWTLGVRQRFIARSGAFLPKGKVLNHLMFPQIVGGFDLYLGDELSTLWPQVPLPTQYACWGLIKGTLTRYKSKCLSGFLTNKVRRGIQTDSFLASIIEDYGPKIAFRTRGLPEPFEKSVLDLKNELKVPYGLDPSTVMLQLRAKGWRTLDEVLEEVTRSNLFSDIMSGRAKRNIYNTEPWLKRYENLWDALLDPETDTSHCATVPSAADFKKLNWLGNFNSLKLYFIDRKGEYGWLEPPMRTYAIEHDSSSFCVESGFPSYAGLPFPAVQFVTGYADSEPPIEMTTLEVLNAGLPSLKISCLEDLEDMDIPKKPKLIRKSYQQVVEDMRAEEALALAAAQLAVEQAEAEKLAAASAAAPTIHEVSC